MEEYHPKLLVDLEVRIPSGECPVIFRKIVGVVPDTLAVLEYVQPSVICLLLQNIHPSMLTALLANFLLTLLLLRFSIPCTPEIAQQVRDQCVSAKWGH